MNGGTHSSRDELQRYVVILRCQAGDEQAFEWLYDRFHGRTLRYLMGILEGDGVLDVQQEVWLTVYRRICQLDNPRSFRTWLYRLTRNRAIDHLRGRRRHSELIEAAAAEWAEPPVRWVTGGGNEEEIRPEDLKSAVELLSPTHREVVVLKYWEGMSYEEMAVIIGCPVGTVRSRIYYAKKHLEALLNNDPG